jgi:hypothetical protein
MITEARNSTVYRPTKTESRLQRNVHTHIFLTALFAESQDGNNPGVHHQKNRVRISKTSKKLASICCP